MCGCKRMWLHVSPERACQCKGKVKRFQVKNIDGKVVNGGFMFLVHEMKLFHQYHHNVMQGSGFRFSLIMQGIAIINTIGAILSGWSSLTSKSLWKIFSWIIPELNFSPLYSWIFFNFKMKKKKKKSGKQFQTLMFLSFLKIYIWQLRLCKA